MRFARRYGYGYGNWNGTGIGDFGSRIIILRARGCGLREPLGRYRSDATPLGVAMFF